MGEETLFVKIQSRDRTFFEGTVKALSSVNEKGNFDVLSQHENFISLVRDFLIIRQEGGEEREIKIEGGVLEVSRNRVQVFLGF